MEPINLSEKTIDSTLINLPIEVKRTLVLNAFAGTELPTRTTAVKPIGRTGKRSARPVPRLGKSKAKRARTTIDDALIAKVKAVFVPTDGYATSQLETMTGLKESTIKNVINVMREKKLVFKGGDRRFTRYALTQEVANAASATAKAGGVGTSTKPVKRGAKKTKKAAAHKAA